MKNVVITNTMSPGLALPSFHRKIVAAIMLVIMKSLKAERKASAETLVCHDHMALAFQAPATVRKCSSSRFSAPKAFTVGLPVMMSASVAPILVSHSADSRKRGARTLIESQMLAAQ